MSEYAEQGIKDIILNFPEVENILTEYNIECGACGVGLCQLKDVVEIHRLDDDVEEELLARISQAIAPEAGVEVSTKAAKAASKPKPLSYRPAIKKMVDEHTLIKRMLAIIPSLIENMNLETEEGRQLVLDSLDFIRSYADRYHHAKEEDILFKFFDPDLDIIKVMDVDHTTGRNHVKAVAEAVTEQDRDKAAENLEGYRLLLTEHIKKEDELLYPWMQSRMNITQLDELFERCSRVDTEMGPAVYKYPPFIKSLEEKFGLGV